MPTDPTHVRYVYKCRLCGRDDIGDPQDYGLVHDEIEQLSFDSKRSVTTGVAYPYNIHYCDDGSIGIADLQGARAERAE